MSLTQSAVCALQLHSLAEAAVERPHCVPPLARSRETNTPRAVRGRRAAPCRAGAADSGQSATLWAVEPGPGPLLSGWESGRLRAGPAGVTRFGTTTRLSGAHGRRPRGGQAAGRYVFSPGGQLEHRRARRVGGPCRAQWCMSGQGISGRVAMSLPPVPPARRPEMGRVSLAAQCNSCCQWRWAGASTRYDAVVLVRVG